MLWKTFLKAIYVYSSNYVYLSAIVYINMYVYTTTYIDEYLTFRDAEGN